MARSTGFNCVISIDSSDISGKSNEVTLSFNSPDIEEVGGFAEAWEVLVGGKITTWSLSINGVYDGAATEIDSILFAWLGDGIQSLDHLRPQGTGSGLVEYSAATPASLIGVILESYEVPIPRTGAVKWSANFRGSGEVTRSQQV